MKGGDVLGPGGAIRGMWELLEWWRKAFLWLGIRSIYTQDGTSGVRCNRPVLEKSWNIVIYLTNSMLKAGRK